MIAKYFFDVPVYRLEKEHYNQRRDKYVDDAMVVKNSRYSQEHRRMDEEDAVQNAMFRDYLRRSYGGCWRFNEIIGYIRLYFFGSQIRGEYFGVNKARMVKTRTKILEFQALKLVPEMDVPYPPRGNEILKTVREYLKRCKSALPRRHIDISMFEAVAPYIEWQQLYEDSVAQG
jgi:hypothetical protein